MILIEKIGAKFGRFATEDSRFVILLAQTHHLYLVVRITLQ